MTNSELMLQAVTDGRADDVTISAALDSIQEQDECGLLSAVLAVAHAWKNGYEARDIALAAKALRPGSWIRSELMAVIIAECPEADEDGSAMVTVVAGDVWPHLLGGPIPLPRPGRINQHIGVGAEWVISRASVIRVNRAKARRTARRQRSR